MTHGSTFSGIGGPEVAAAMLGWDNVFHCEINPFGRQILDYYFPNAKSYEDITKTDFSEWRGRIDILTGGFPCQPFSTAGKRRGAEDDRYLWPYMLKCIDQIRPTWFVGENVAGIASMVLPGETTPMASAATLFDEGDTYTRTEQRFVIEEICRNLEGIGYEVQPMLIPACGVGAPHRRDRIFFIAHRVAEDSVNLGLKGGDSVVGHLSGSRHTCAAGGDGQVEFPSPNADLRDDRAESRHNGEEEEEEERIQERHDIREPRLTSGLRPKSGRDASDTESRRTRVIRNESSEEGSRCSDDRLGERGGLLCGEGTPSNTDLQRLNESVTTEIASGEERLHREEDSHRRDTDSEGDGGAMDGGTRRDASDTDINGLQGRLLSRCNGEQGRSGSVFTSPFSTDRVGSLYGSKRWSSFPTQPAVLRVNDGLPFDVDNLSIPFNKWKTATLTAYGNAIVPQVILTIFEAIEEIENGSQV